MIAGKHPHGQPASSPPPLLQLAGWLLLLVYAACWLLTDKLGEYASYVLILMTAASLAVYRGPLRSSLATQLLVAALVVQLITWALGNLLDPQLAERSPKLHRLAAWFFLIPVALFLDGSRQRTFLLWLTGVLAICLSPWATGNGWAEIRAGLGGSRINFGIVNSQHSGMLAALALLGMAAFLNRLLSVSAVGNRRWWRLPYTLVALAMMATTILTQTRGVWLGLMVALLGACLFLFWRSRAMRKTTIGVPPVAGHRRSRYAIAALILLVPALFGGLVNDRVASENPFSVFSVEDGEEPVMKESVRIRLYTWREALDWIVQRPLFGWGGNGRRMVVAATPELTKAEIGRFGHLHNSYLDTLVNYGLAGLLVWFCLLGWLSTSVARAWRDGQLADDWLLFWLAFLLYWLVINMFESYMYYHTGVYAFALVAGGMLTLTTCHRTESDPQ